MRALLTRRASLECLALLALATTTASRAAAPAADAPAMSDIERAHAELAGESALALGRQIAGILGPAAAGELLESEAVRFSRCRQSDPSIDARGLLGRLAAEDYRANQVLELKGLWLARIEVALLLAPVLQSPVAAAG
jgi:hypothetical protein